MRTRGLCHRQFRDNTGRTIDVNVAVVPVERQYIVTELHPEIQARRAKGLPEMGVLPESDSSWHMREETGGLLLGPYEVGAPACCVAGPSKESKFELFQEDLQLTLGWERPISSRRPTILADAELAKPDVLSTRTNRKARARVKNRVSGAPTISTLSAPSAPVCTRKQACRIVRLSEARGVGAWGGALPRFDPHKQDPKGHQSRQLDLSAHQAGRRARGVHPS